jgi:hypothetical protein
MECSSSGCGNKVFSRLLCRNHYEKERLASAAPCSFSGCDKPQHRSALCTTHYRLHVLSQRPKCNVPDCNNPQKNMTMGLCGKHESRMRNHASVGALRPNDWGAREKHPLYKTWLWHKRVNNLCVEWASDFWDFVSAIGDRPEGHTLRKLDGDATLGPHNWEWKKSISSASKAQYSREWRNANPLKAKNIDLKKHYGIGLAEYEAMLKEQNGVCGICKKPETARNKDGGPRRMPVDHCHATGEIRGLLCTHCNRGLGMFKDSAVNLQSAIDYLARFG